MASSRDTQRIGGINAEFSDSFTATAHGGAALCAQVLRRLNLRGILQNHLPSRGPNAMFSAVDGVFAWIAALMLGGQGFSAAEGLRRDAQACTILSIPQGGVPEEATMYRVACDLAGLEQRDFDKTYECIEKQERLPAVDIFGTVIKAPTHRRIVPEAPEYMKQANKEKMNKTHDAIALACISRMNASTFDLGNYRVLHVDGTDVEVRGSCFDAARKNRKGDRSLTWMTVKQGPVTLAQELSAGASDEGASAPAVVAHGVGVLKKSGYKGRILVLKDSAFCEAACLEKDRDLGLYYITGANQMRDPMRKVAEQLPVETWKKCGSDAKRGWNNIQINTFSYMAETWKQKETVVVRRWKEDLTGEWHYAFVVTNMEKGDIPGKLLKKHGYCASIWMLYGSKQGHENYYKRTLTDLGLHHPPSGRMGAAQVFYTIGSMTANILALISYKVMSKKDRGIRLARLLRDYIVVAAQVVWSAGRRLLVRLSGQGFTPERRERWLAAFACAGRL